MNTVRWAVLTLYTACIFLSLPYTPRLVRWSSARFGPAAGVGFLDELVQLVTPGRVFDWWDVAPNAAAALLGGLACAWWRWTAGARP